MLFNLAKVSKTPLRTQLSALRKRYASGESGMNPGEGTEK